MRSLVQISHGSHLYGTNTPNSDVDIKGVHLPDMNAVLLGRSPKVITENTKPIGSTEKNTPEDRDFESMSLHQFIKLAIEGQTVALDMLFANKESIIHSSPEWDYLVENRRRLISKKCESFLGYCKQQANKYGIKGSRVAAVRTIVDILEQDDIFPLQSKMREYNWQRVADSYEFIDVVEIIQTDGTPLKHLSVCNRKVPYTVTVKEALRVYTGLLNEYGKRAIQAESNEGVDWKAMSHAVRVGRMALTILSGEDIVFPLSYAEHLLNIKLGKLDYKIVAKQVEDLLEAIERVAEVSPLPAEPDIEWAEQFILHMYKKEIINA